MPFNARLTPRFATSPLIVGVIMATSFLRAQTLAPVNPLGAQSGRVARLGSSASKRLFLPLLGATEKEVETFYVTSNWLAPLQQVKFLYGFGQGSKSLSVDLASMEFPLGVQTTFGSSVTAPAKDTTGTTQATTDSATQALQRLKAGGDFYVRAAYPLFAAENSAKTNMFTVFSISTLGLNISGFGNETTITESTEHNFNSGIEAYGQYGAIGGKGFLYADYRGGLQTVQTDFARSVGLTHKNFGLGQFAVGFQFAGFMRIGFQKFFGPPAAFATTRDELSKWHLVLQIMPLPK
jgi:hypothetical protein